MFTRAWDECVELQVTPKDDWVRMALHSLSELDRYEVHAFADGKIVGGLVLAADPWDVHVGPCVSVFAQYVMPEWRNKGASPRMMREAIRVARDCGAQVLAFTHRVGPWRYQTIYRRLA